MSSSAEKANVGLEISTVPLNSIPVLEESPSALEVVMSSAEKANVGLKSSTVPLNSIPDLEESPSGSAIVQYATHRRGWSRKKLRSIEKKSQTLSLHFTPITFPPKNRPLEFANHKDFLVRLGLCDFLNIDFDQNIRVDLIKELVLCYTTKSPYYVPGLRISLSRGDLAAALSLPSGKVGRDENFVLSQDEISFLTELIWGWLVLKDEDEVLDKDCMLKFFSYIENMNWVSLIWLMMKRELLKGMNLVNCYYATHMQLVLKKQRPTWFYDQVPEVGSIENGKDTGILVMCTKRKMEYEKLAKERKLFRGKKVMSDSEEEKSRRPHMNDEETVDQTWASEENVQVTLNAFQGCCGSEKDEEVIDLEEEQGNEAECEANIGVSHEIHYDGEDDEVIEDKAYISNSDDVYCEQKDGMMEENEHCPIEDKAIEAESEAR